MSRTRLKRLFDSVSGGAWGTEPEEGEVALPCVRGTDFDYQVLRSNAGRAPLRGFSRHEIAKRAARRGDLIIEKSGGGEQQPVGRAVLHDSDEPVMPTNFAARLSPSQDNDPRFVTYLLSSLYANGVTRSSIKQTTGIQNLDLHSFLDTIVSCPSPRMQRAIADFLDAETARIDALAAKKRKLVSLLRQRLTAFADHHVRNLLAASNRVRLQRVVSEVDDRLGSEDPPQLLLVSIHEGVVPREEFTDRLARADELTAYKRCRTGDLVLNRMRAFQGGVGRAPIPGIVSPDYTVIRPKDELDSSFLHHIARSPWFVGEMTSRLRGIGGSEQGNVRTPRINFADLKLIEVPLPSTEEQRRFADQIERDSSIVRLAARKLQRQMELLEEHRQALITAAVTGQLEVPGVAA